MEDTMQGQDPPTRGPSVLERAGMGMRPQSDREATPAEVQFQEREAMQRAELEDIRRRLEFGRADVAAMEQIERNLLAALASNEPDAQVVPRG